MLIKLVQIFVLLDNIELNREFTVVTDNKYISQSPGFNLERVIDNKKSWVDSTLNRQSSISNNNGSNTIRQTNYNNNDRLVLNSKEVDLDMHCIRY
jgi:hypothetical protein